MTPEPQFLQLPAAEAALNEVPAPALPVSAGPIHDAPLALDSPESKIASQNPKIFNGRRGNGKVARLPEALREQVNHWILDGVSYPEIIQRLGDDGKHLNPDNLQEWKKFGYQDWLLERDWLERLSSKAEFSTHILAAPNSANLHEAGLRIAASQLLDQLMRFTASAEGDSPGQPEKLARLANALSRLTREALVFQKYRDGLAKTAAAELAERDPDRELADEELRLLVNKMDRTFKVARPNLEAILAGAPDRGKRRQTPSPVSPKSDKGGSSSSIPSGEVVLSSDSPSDPAPVLRSAFDEGGSSIEHPASDPSADSGKSKLKNQKSKIPDEAVDRGPKQHESNGTNPERLINTPIHRGENDHPSPPQEFCPRCHTPLPPRASNGERPSPHCQRHDCGSPVRTPGAPYEPCPHCGVTLPDLLPNGERPAAACPECKKALPSPPQEAIAAVLANTIPIP